MSGRPADTACWGRCHAPIKSRQTSPTGDERHSESWSGPTADSLKQSQLAAGQGAFTSRRTSPTKRIETASLIAVVSTGIRETPAWDEHRAPWPTRRGLPLRLSEARARARVRRRSRLVHMRRAFGASGDAAHQRSSGASAGVACRPLLVFVQGSSEFRLEWVAVERCCRREAAVSTCAPARRR
jgi:hypothetical protein